MSVEIFAVIPARGGSKGILRKNMRSLAGKPLITYTIDAAQASQLLGRVVVSTEDREIADLAAERSCEVLHRPNELAQDETPMVPVIRHAINTLAETDNYEPEITLILQPTAPLRRAEHIDAALRLLLDSNAGSVVSVCPVPGHFNPEWQFLISPQGLLQTYSGQMLSEIRTRRQELPITYSRNGAIYAFRTQRFLHTGSLYVEPCMPYVMKNEDSVNLDSKADFWLAEHYLRKRKRESR
jgi:CMP-N,N'-diacetyllegionaminic acid synthase